MFWNSCNYKHVVYVVSVSHWVIKSFPQCGCKHLGQIQETGKVQRLQVWLSGQEHYSTCDCLSCLTFNTSKVVNQFQSAILLVNHCHSSFFPSDATSFCTYSMIIQFDNTGWTLQTLCSLLYISNSNFFAFSLFFFFFAFSQTFCCYILFVLMYLYCNVGES